MVTRRKFSWKSKLKAVKLVMQREVSVPQAAKFDNLKIPQDIATKGTMGAVG